MPDKEKNRKVFIKTFGCQMNVRDSEVVKGLLAAEGYKLVDDEKGADIVLFNTCSVRQHAEDKVWSEIGKFKNHKPIIGVIGCMAQNYKKEIFKRAPSVDIVCGPGEIDNIALYLEEVLRKKDVILAVGEKKRREEIYHTGFYEVKDHAYVVISEGCDNFCSYCVVPFVRGRLRHRDPGEIVKEIKGAIACGVSNITLLGQNVNSYKNGRVDFVELLKEASGTAGLKSLSFVTSHPKDTKKDLFEFMAREPVIKKCLHLPLQSGSDKVLKAMNRGYTVAKYIEIVDQYRSIVYNGQLSTDLIVGYPGETDEDFKRTFELVTKVRFDRAYIFKYSPRPNTKAAQKDDDVPQAVKRDRHRQLLDLQREISGKKREIAR